MRRIQKIKIKVTFKKEFDSDDQFEEDYDFTEREFKDLIFEHIIEDTDFIDNE